MNIRDAIHRLLGERKGDPLLTYEDLRLVFHEDSPAALAKGLRKLVHLGLLERVTRSLYLNRAANINGATIIGELVGYLRAGYVSYLSYESALADHGSINQVPVVSTFATTGRSGHYTTRYGTIDFTKTRRPIREILENTRYCEHTNVFVASPALALSDTRRSRPWAARLVDDIYHNNALTEWEADA